MSNLWIFFAGGAIVIVVVFAFAKTIFFDRRKIKKLFSQLISSDGYNKINPTEQEIVGLIKRFFLPITEKEQLSPLSIITKADPSGKKFIADILYSYFWPETGNTLFYLTLLVNVKPINIYGDIYICRKIPKIVKRYFDWANKKRGLMEIQTGLTSDFAQNFNVYSSDVNVNFDVFFQEKVNELNAIFPFNRPSSFGVVLHICPEGVAFINDRIFNKEKIKNLMSIIENF